MRLDDFNVSSIKTANVHVLFLQLPHRLITTSNATIRYSLAVDIGPITPRSDFVFVPNRLPNLFTRRPEIPVPFQQKSSPAEGGVGH